MRRGSWFYERGYERAVHGRRAARAALASLRLLQEYLAQYMPASAEDDLLKQLLDSQIERALDEMRRGIRRRIEEKGWGEEQ